MGEEELLNIQQIADKLDVSRRTVERWVESGKLTKYKVPRRSTGMYSLEEAEKLKR